MLPLHIFEPRYRVMLQACLAGDERFGVVLIAEGPEVGGPAIPHRVGTVARVVRVETLADGRLNLLTTGERRFTIERTWLDPAGYLMGEVTLRPEILEGEPAVQQALVAEVRAALSEYVGRLTPDPRPVQSELAQVTDPSRLGGLAASLIRGDNLRRQHILETDSVLDRLRQLHGLLRRELLILETLARPTQAALRRDIISPN
jgi:Lon protease-like protein